MSKKRYSIYPEQRTGRVWEAPTYVYVILNEARKVLYVGISMAPRLRIHQHMRKPWFPAHVRLDFHGPMTREDALIMEGIFIERLKPPHNNHPGYWLCDDGRFTIFDPKFLAQS